MATGSGRRHGSAQVERLRELVTAREWPGRAPGRPTVRQLALAVRRHSTVMVVSGDRAAAGIWRELIGELWPEARVVIVLEDEDESEVHARLTAAAPFHVILHLADTTPAGQARTFRRVFFHLATRGIYLTPHVGGDLWDVVATALAARMGDFEDPRYVGVATRDVRGLARQLGQVQVRGRSLLIRNRRRVQAKLKEAETDRVLAERPDIGREVTSIPSERLVARAPYRHNLPRDPWFREVIDAPKITLRSYDEPVCGLGQVVSSHDVLLPDTFRHHLRPRVTNRYVSEVAPRFGRVRHDLAEPDPLPGAWFHLDSEWPGHFGHMLTEQLGRMWAWQKVRELEPDVRLLMTVQRHRRPMALLPFERELLAAFDVTPDEVHLFTRPCRPERLYAATPLFSANIYLHPAVLEVWQEVGDRIESNARDVPRPRRIFCTRPSDLKRPCHNAAEVEELFCRHGFDVVRPELFTLAEQVAMFRAAEAIGGFAGSALFTLALCPTPKPVFTVGSATYTARNEQLIAAALGHPMVSAWSNADVSHPPGAWTPAAFTSGFTFDLEREGRFLEKELQRLAPLAPSAPSPFWKR